jgi:integrase
MNIQNILINRLSKVDLWKLPPGRHEDGLGLSLLVSKDGGSRSWTLRAHDAAGNAVNRGLGGLRKVGLIEARQRRDALLVIAAQTKDDEMVPSAPAVFKVPTFAERAAEVIPVQTAGQKCQRAVYQWERSLLHYAAPLSDKPVNAITTADVVAVLQPIWLKKPPTARKVRKHIAKVFSSCIADQLIERNPAAWEDNLEHKMPKQRKRTCHHPAMPYADVPAYVAALEADGSLGALALAFTILTCVRSAEAFTARHDDIDADGVWNVRSGEELKNGQFARVPLPARALAIIEKAKAFAVRGNGATYIFPGKEDGHLSRNTMLKLLQATHPTLTVHGFRSSFRTWGQEATTIEHDTLEYCLHHIEGSRTVQAYARGECLDKRRAALEQWAAYLTLRPVLKLVA